MAKNKSVKQVKYLLSSGSPLNPTQKAKLKSELHSGAIKVAKKAPTKPSNFSSARFERTRKKIYNVKE